MPYGLSIAGLGRPGAGQPSRVRVEGLRFQSFLPTRTFRLDFVVEPADRDLEPGDPLLLSTGLPSGLRLAATEEGPR
jgi:hypothetical protein